MFDDIIKYENEHTGLDFKAIQYKKEKYLELLKDIVAMANVDMQGERLIIVGVKHKPNGEKEFLSIQEDEFIDASTYQQLIHENVEPELSISYEPYNYNGKLLGVLKILGCKEQPYMLKKDYGKLKRGDCFIRKGTIQMSVTRLDLERIYSKRYFNNPFKDKIELGFSDSKFSSEIDVNPITVDNLELRSDRERKKINEAIEAKKNETELEKAYLVTSSFTNAMPFQAVPYKNQSVSTLYTSLKSVKTNYEDDDYYEVCELHAFKLNIDILNKAAEYIEDVSVELEIIKEEGFFISTEILEKPNHSFYPHINTNSIMNKMSYPNVENSNEKYFVSQHIGNIKHQIKTKIFNEDLRMVIYKVPQSSKIVLQLTLYGKNLSEPIKKELMIRVIGENV
jgi:hypothetical protein